MGGVRAASAHTGFLLLSLLFLKVSFKCHKGSTSFKKKKKTPFKLISGQGVLVSQKATRVPETFVSLSAMGPKKKR